MTGHEEDLERDGEWGENTKLSSAWWHGVSESAVKLPSGRSSKSYSMHTFL